ncbi:MAG: hypothetical protein GC134_09355 [Proteobacteria bacterium]|nr:hypothetical protein [Pseudomonadota bacterium]
MFKSASFLAAASLAVLLLAGCQTTGTSAPAPAAPQTEVVKADVDVSGLWKGTFTNRKGQTYHVEFTLAVDNGKLSGHAYLPASTYDKRPAVTGTVSGNKVSIYNPSSNFHYELTLSADGKTLSGKVIGSNPGTMQLTR